MNGETLAQRGASLRRALELGGDRLEVDAAEKAQVVLDRLEERVAMGTSHTVVALVGTTGSGKSSLMNALAGMEVAKSGARRPTTTKPVSCQWGDGGHDILAWLDVPTQHRTLRDSALDADRFANYSGLILVDIPDFDSDRVEHRAQVDEIVGRVDMLVWVTDPQKYADDVWHSDYLSHFTDHQDVMVVALNQVDLLPESDVTAVAGDLKSLLTKEGLGAVPVVCTSAVTGVGVDVLAGMLTARVAARDAMWSRWSADLDTSARELSRGLAPSEARVGQGKAMTALVDALMEAAGAEALGDAVYSSYVREAHLRTGWPITRWWTMRKMDPLQRVGLGLDVDAQTATSSLPPVGKVTKARVEQLSRGVIADACDGLPPRWQQAVHDADVLQGDDLVDTLDQAVMRVDVHSKPPVWWSVANVAQWLFALVLFGGAGLTLAGAIASWFSIDIVTEQLLGPLPLAGVLVLTGLFGGFAISFFGSAIARSRAKRRRGEVLENLEEHIRDVAHVRVVSPVGRVLDEHRRTREALSSV